MNTTQDVQKYSLNQFDEHDLKGKKVLVRLDLNTSLGENQTVDPGEDWRIQKALPTLQYLSDKGAIVIVLSHIGRDPHESLKPVFEYMQQFIAMGFIPEWNYELIEYTLRDMQHGSIVMLENVRSQPGETEDDANYLKPITDQCDLYVNDAFSVSHRKQASVHAVTELLPSYFGLQFIDEVNHLSKIFDYDQDELVLVLGGAKFGTKLDLLKKMLPKISYALVGGALANVFLRERGFEIGESFADDSVDISFIVNDPKIIIPVDCVDQDGDILDIDEVREHDMILDIAPKTEQLFEQILNHAKAILWNGPMGKYEDGYVSGSVAVAESISHANAYSVTGGGDTATVILEQDLADRFDFISTGGGAMLDYLVEGTLPGIEAILKNHTE